jgi:tRNA dimethylallyltransferase
MVVSPPLVDNVSTAKAYADFGGDANVPEFRRDHGRLISIRDAGLEADVKRAHFILLAGPTASGKSQRALDLAREHGGVVVNADSMQVYRELRVLSARPSAEDEAAMPHFLYGHVAAATRYSVGAWLADVAPVLAEAKRSEQTAIVVGGTGLYFKALTEGLVAMPTIPTAVRDRIKGEIAGVETDVLHARLESVDPEDAAAIRPSDRSRIVRALEVFTATGASLAVWQRTGEARPLIDLAEAARLVLTPDRAALHRRISERAEMMVRRGALEEARALGAQNLDPALPAMKAIGVRELLDYIAGKISLAETAAAIATETRRYAKRQMTWFRNQMGDWGRRD